MRCMRILPVLTLAVLAMGGERLVAQSSTSSGTFGNRTTGTGVTASSGSAFGSNSALGSLSQSNASGAPTLNSAAGVGGQARQAGSFVGANSSSQASQQGFIGAAQASANGQGGQGGMGGMGGGFGGGGLGGGGYGGYGGGGLGGVGRGLVGQAVANRLNTPTAPQIRTALTMAIDLPPAPSAEALSSDMAGHLAAMPALHWDSPAQVQLQGRTAILRGVVATAHDRDLAERVVRLEATVDQVQNLLEVAALPAGAAGPSTTAGPAASMPAASSSAGGNSAAAGNSAAGNSAVGSAGNSAAGNSAGMIVPPTGPRVPPVEHILPLATPVAK
jgi:hypothetical protein